MTTIVREPRIDERFEQPYMGIRARVPMNSLSKNVTAMFKEINSYSRQHKIEPAGPPFLRYHVINMTSEMDIEVGIPVTAPLPNEGRVCAGIIPAGRYASLVYIGSGYTGNKVLIEWAKANGIRWDRWDDPNGDAFRSRYETYLTDPKIEPKKTKWEVEVAIKLANEMR